MFKTLIAKHTVSTIVSTTVANAVSNLITDNTETDKDDFVVQIPSAVVGYMVAHKLRPYTDAMVDKTVAKIQSFKNHKDTTE